MEIIEDRALLMRLRNPKQVTTVIPKSKELGDSKVLVHWGVDETCALREMGIKAPSPIRGRYDWPGKFKPMDHQRETAEFLTLQKKSFCFNEQGCVDSETEYLSPTGWVKISEYKGGEVAQYDPNIGEIDFVEPEEYVKLPCTDMIRIKTKYGVDQLLSPEHRVLLEDGKKPNKRETVNADTLLARHDSYHAGQRATRGGTRGGTDTVAFSAASVPTTFRYFSDSSMSYSDAELRVLVATIADGHFGSNTKHCAVRLKKERKKERLRALLGDAEIDYTETSCQPEGFSRFTFYAPERWKEFGPEFWEASAKQIDVITSEVLYWDGCTTRGERFSTSSKASADFIQFAFSSQRSCGGGTARVTQRERKGSVEYTVQIRRGTERLFLRGSDSTMRPEPSTDGFKYCFRVPTTYLLFRRNGCVFASGNTGKTASAIWAADFLMKQGKVRRVLIICPVSIMDSAWRADLFSVAMHRKVDVAYGSAEKRKKIVNSDAEFIVINYDGLKVVADDIAAGGFDLIIVDEASHYNNVQTQRWKTLNKLVGEDTWLWLMTGTPAAQSPLGAYGLAKLVNPSSVPRYAGAFKDMVMTQKSKFKWEPKPDAVNTVHRVLQPAIRFSKEQCLDLPDMVYTKRFVPMTKQQELYYKKLKKDMVLEAAGSEVTAVNAAVNMNKLLQISAGALYTDDGDTLQFDINNRYSVLKEVVDEAANKVLVFVPFKSTIAMLTERLRADGIATEVISGDVPVHARTEIFKAFQTTPTPRVLVIQPQSAAHGVTLTAADTVVWWAPTASLETYAQANARVHRSGQKNKCTVVQLESSPVETRLYTMLDKRIDVHGQVLELYKDLLD